MNNLLIKNLPLIFRHLSETNYDQLFFRAKDQLPIPFQNLFPPQPTALVHNSPQLLQTPLGKEIDTYPTIIRFLPFRISSYEAYTGSKTSLWITENLSTNPTPWDRNNGFFLPILMTGHFLSFQKKQDLLKAQYGEKALAQCLIFHDDTLLHFFRKTTNMIPSGTMILLLLLALRYKQIRLFGFDLSASNTYFITPLPRSLYQEKEKETLQHLLQKKILYT